MVLFNHATREMTAKIVYYGPGLCGKTTNLLVIYDKLDNDAKGKMLSLATRSDRTLFFDLLPVDLGKVGNFRLKIQLYTVPGQVFYNETRKLVLRGTDAVVFVVDSQSSMVDSNRDSFANLFENLKENRIDADDVPIVIQYNKRDIPGVLPVRQLEKELGLDGYPSLEASALKGEGVMETFRLVSKLTAQKLLERLEGKSAESSQGEPAAIEENSQRTEESPSEFKNPADIAAAGAGFDRTDVAPVDHAPFDEDYDGMEEVSLEQLLEGRDRPLTIGVPSDRDEEVDELSDADLIEEVPEPLAQPESPESGAQGEEPATARSLEVQDDEEDSLPTNLEAEVIELRAELVSLRAEYDQLVASVISLAAQLAKLVDKNQR